MKIVCTRCKVVIGEQKPYKNTSEIKAKCVFCITKEKEAQLEYLKTHTLSDLEKTREIEFENGWKGFLSIAGKETESLSFWDLLVAGKKISCYKDAQGEFKKYLESIPEDEVNVTFLHSAKIKLNEPIRKRRKDKAPELAKEKEPESTHYNCTIRVPKYFVLPMFDDKAEKVEQFVKILSEITYRTYLEDCKKAAKNADLSTMSGSKQVDIPISK